MLYHYKAFVTRIIDGDTIEVTVDLGLNIVFKNMKLRLQGIDAPEIVGINKTSGLASKLWLNDMILDKEVIIHTYKDKGNKYGRYLAVVLLDGVNINELSVQEGFAKKWE